MNELSTFEVLALAAGSIGFGMFLLAKGGGWTIDSAVFLARRMGVSNLLIGFTVLAFGTSLPELLVAANANLSGFPDLALGNVVGSNIANILLIIGATALIYQVATDPKSQRADAALMVAATLAFAAILLAGGAIDRWQGLSLFGALIAYVVWQYRTQLRAAHAGGPHHAAEAEEIEPAVTGLAAALGLLLLGLVALALGAEFLVRGAVAGARVLGVPEAVIGLTIVALGTSLPELATCVAAAVKRQTDLILGNIVGSNAFNILAIIGITAGIKPIAITGEITLVDIGLMVGITLAFAGWMVTKGAVGRKLGLGLLAGYVAYMGWLAIISLPVAG